MTDWRELPFEVHNRPAPVRVWQFGRWYAEWAAGFARNAWLLADSLDPFGWCVMFDTPEELRAYANHLDLEREP